VNLELAILLAGAVLIVSARTRYVLAAYVVLAAIASALIAPSALISPMTFAIFALTTTLKVIVAPLGMIFFLRGNPAAGQLRPSLTMPQRLALAIAFAIVAAQVAHLPALAGIPMQRVVAFVILCGTGMLVVYRNLLAHLLGLLALGAGITLAGAVLAPQLPESVELGATFDALVGTFIGLALVRAFLAHNPLLDVDSLRRLRG
jgi:hydrogenase-4 membrane subunit HyfE